MPALAGEKAVLQAIRKQEEKSRFRINKFSGLKEE